MASVLHGTTANFTRFSEIRATCLVGISAFPPLDNRLPTSATGKCMSKSLFGNREYCLQGRGCKGVMPKRVIGVIPRSSSDSNNSADDESPKQEKTPFGYTRKDVLLIGVGVTALGYGLKYGLEFVGVNPLQAGNVVQLLLVLGLTVGWISTYIFRVSNKEMTYAQQLRSYEKQVIEKRFDGLTEAEIIALLEQVEEEKRQLKSKQVK